MCMYMPLIDFINNMVQYRQREIGNIRYYRISLY